MNQFQIGGKKVTEERESSTSRSKATEKEGFFFQYLPSSKVLSKENPTKPEVETYFAELRKNLKNILGETEHYLQSQKIKKDMENYPIRIVIEHPEYQERVENIKKIIKDKLIEAVNKAIDEHGHVSEGLYTVIRRNRSQLTKYIRSLSKFKPKGQKIPIELWSGRVSRKCLSLYNERAKSLKSLPVLNEDLASITTQINDSTDENEIQKLKKIRNRIQDQINFIQDFIRSVKSGIKSREHYFKLEFVSRSFLYGVFYFAHLQDQEYFDKVFNYLLSIFGVFHYTTTDENNYIDKYVKENYYIDAAAMDKNQLNALLKKQERVEAKKAFIPSPDELYKLCGINLIDIKPIPGYDDTKEIWALITNETEDEFEIDEQLRVMNIFLTN